ncbi:hypothetical protein GYMLUDRAFT_56533 [Collybiopsis luxurians FD-317 M1]|nr:hypothetical protein GYMLUDRAFT_56533 [Collybiopsis luxurians FD-317 M1]
MFTTLRSLSLLGSSLSRPHNASRLTVPSALFVSRLLSTSRAHFAPRFVYLGNLPWSAEIPEIKEHAEKFGTLLSINIPNDSNGRPAGFANVEFESPEDAQNFFQAALDSQLRLGNRRTRIELFEEPQEEPVSRLTSTAKPRLSSPTSTIWIGQLPLEAQDDDLRKVFEQFGSIRRVSISHGPRPFAHVEYLKKADAEAAMTDLQGKAIVLDSPVVLDYAAVKTDPPNNKLYISQFDGDLAELRKLFQDHKEGLGKMVMLKNRNAIVEYENVEQAAAAKDALDLSESSSGRRFRVFFSSPRPTRTESSDSSRYIRRSKSYGGDW